MSVCALESSIVAGRFACIVQFNTTLKKPLHSAASIDSFYSVLVTPPCRNVNEWCDRLTTVDALALWALQLPLQAAERLNASHSISNNTTLSVLDIQEVERLTSIKGLPAASLPPSLVSALAGLPGFIPGAAAASSWGKLKDLWQRRSSDDLAFMIMLAVNDCATPVPSTQVSSS
jgi:hypothetical protein